MRNLIHKNSLKVTLKENVFKIKKLKNHFVYAFISMYVGFIISAIQSPNFLKIVIVTITPIYIIGIVLQIRTLHKTNYKIKQKIKSF